jgi:hypothetical protein
MARKLEKEPFVKTVSQDLGQAGTGYNCQPVNDIKDFTKMPPNLAGSPFFVGSLRSLLSLSYAVILNAKSFRRVGRRTRLNRLRRA